MKRMFTLVAACVSCVFASGQVSHIVQVGPSSSMTFSPSALTINQGDTVHFESVSSPMAHNVNGSTGTFPSNPVGFYSGSPQSGTWTYTFVFNTAGSYDYQCDPHAPSMSGTITVNPSVPPVTPCSKPFFSEYIEGSGNNKGLEIYNPTAAPLDMSPYKVYISNNGGASGVTSMKLTGTLAPGDVQVIVTDQAAAALQAVADYVMPYPSVTHFNGDDAVYMIDTTTNDTVDIIGVIGVDPGSSWPVNTGSTAEHTLVRKAAVTNGQKDWAIGATEWDVYPQNTYTFLGAHVSNSCATYVPPPSIRFETNSITELENVGTINVNLIINPVLTTGETVDVQAIIGPGVVPGSDGTISPIPNMTTGIMNVSIPANEDTVAIVVSVIDDALQESTEYIDFKIISTSTLDIANPDSVRVSIEDNDTPIPTYTISQINGVDTDCLPDSNGVEVRVYGVVMGVNLQSATSGDAAFSIWDGEGYSVFAGGTSYTVNEGDSIRVIGTIGQFNGLMQINADSIVVVGTGATLPAPMVTTTLSEANESELVRFNNATLLNPADWGTGGSGFNAIVTNGTDTITVRVDIDVNDVYSMPAPTGVFDVIGLVGQFDSSTPRCEGYQLLPRYMADIVQAAPPTYDLSITEVMPNSNDASLNQDWFEIANHGSVAYDLAGFSFSDDAAISGMNLFPAISIAPNEVIVVWAGNASDEAAFVSNWNLSATPQIISVDELTNGSFPSLSSTSDAVILYDTSATAIEICRVDYTSTLPGVSLEFDSCSFEGFSVVGTNGAVASNGGDIGSPGNTTIGLEESQLSQIKAYPNPAEGEFTLALPFEGRKEVRIMSLTGVVVAQLATETTKTQVGLSGLPAGVYFVSITNGDAQRTIRLILK